MKLFLEHYDKFHHVINSSIVVLWLALISILILFLLHKNWQLSTQLLAFSLLIPATRAESTTPNLEHHFLVFLVSGILVFIMIISTCIICCRRYYRYTPKHRLQCVPVNSSEVEAAYHPNILRPVGPVNISTTPSAISAKARAVQIYPIARDDIFATYLPRQTAGGAY